MTKRLTRTGNSLALVLDKALLEKLGIDASTELELSTDGDVLIVTPVRAQGRTARLREIAADAQDRFAGAFKRLAE